MSTALESSSTANDSAPSEWNVTRPLTIALSGNPNAGKTTLFNALTGMRQKVANYPGVTVERKEGVWFLEKTMPPARVIDLPGLYSLDASSVDEQIARDVITGRLVGQAAPDVIVCVVDATNLDRNLYLVAQLLEYGRPLVLALTMVDLARRRGVEIDIEELSSGLGVRVVPVTAAKGIGIDALASAVLVAAVAPPPATGWRLEDAAELELRQLMDNDTGKIERHQALRDLFGEELLHDETHRERVELARSRLAANNPDWWQQPLLARYDWIEEIAARTVQGTDDHMSTTTERIDRIITHRFLGPLVLVVVLYLVFQTIFSWASLPMDLIDKGFGVLGDMVRSQLPAGLLADLLVDGVIAGVWSSFRRFFYFFSSSRCLKIAATWLVQRS
jgi:ferrous iron transport protein B